MRALSLFSGIGGIDLALEDYATTVGYVEINQRRLAMGKQIGLSMQVSPTSGQLNPTLVEWLMGYNLEWSALNALVMPAYLFKVKKPLKG